MLIRIIVDRPRFGSAMTGEEVIDVVPQGRGCACSDLSSCHRAASSYIQCFAFQLRKEAGSNWTPTTFGIDEFWWVYWLLFWTGSFHH